MGIMGTMANDSMTVSDVHICDLSCPVEHVMRGAPVVDPEDTLRQTAHAMTVDKAAAAIVRTPAGPTNIVSERDVVRALSDGADPDTVWASDVASPRLGAVCPSSTVSDVLRQVAQEGTRHIPVTVDDHVVGLVMAEDLLEVLHRRLLVETTS